MLLQPAAAAPKDDCQESGGTWVQLGKIGFCFRPLEPDECKLEPIPEPEDPPLRVCGGQIVIDPDSDEEEDSSPEEILDFALDVADVDLDGTEDDDNRGDGTQDDGANNNVSEQDSTQQRSNRNVDTQGNVQRQSEQIVTDGDSPAVEAAAQPADKSG